MLRALTHRHAPVLVYDPVLTSTDIAILKAAGCTPLAEADAAMQTVTEPTLFYMPHCEASLYNDVLDRNWAVDALSNMAIFGNSFGAMLVR